MKKIVKAVESVLGRKIEPVNVIFITNRRSRELNRKYRQKDKPANVLSFPETRDIVLAKELIKEEARQYGFSFKEWATHLTVHGILHLEGYEHSGKMERLEEKVLKCLQKKKS